MIEVKSPEDFQNIEEPKLREWLMKTHTAISSGELYEDDWNPDDVGWLAVFEESDCLEDLSEDFPYNDIIGIDYWEFSAYAKIGDTGYWTAVVVTGNSFGMAMSFPDSIIPPSMKQNLLKTL